MSLEQFTLEELQEMSLIEIAYEILDEKKQPLPFHELVKEIAALAHLSEEEVNARMAQFYTDLNIDGRFMNVGGNTWGIKAWYPVEQIEDEIVPTVRAKKKKAKPGDDVDDFDEIDDEDLDFDDLDEFDEVDEDEFLDEDEDLDDVDEDFDDEDIIEDEDFEDDELLDEDEDLIIDDDFDEDEESTDADEDFDDEYLEEEEEEK